MDLKKFYKKWIIFPAAALILFLAFIGLVAISNGSKPGDFLYGLDRAWERYELANATLKGDDALARQNLALAGERLDEIEAVQSQISTAFLPQLIREVNAQTDDNTVLIGLLNDFNSHVLQASQALERLSLSNLEGALDLAVEVSSVTSEFGNRLNALISEEQLAEIEGELLETSDHINELDDSALDEIVGEIEDNDRDEDNLSVDIDDIALDKIQTKITKAKAKIQAALEKFDEKELSLTDEEIANFNELILGAQDKVDKAQIELGNGNLSNALNLAQLAKAEAELAKDSIDFDEDEQENELEDEFENESEGELDGESKDSEDDLDASDELKVESDDRSGSSSGSSKDDDDDRSGSNSGSSKDDDGDRSGSNSGSSKDEPDEPDEKDDDDDVLGIYTTRGGYLRLLLNF